MTQSYLPGIPAAEPSRMSEAQRVRREIEKYQRTSDELGPLISPVVAARVLGVTRARVTELIRTGKIGRYEFFGHALVALPEVRAYRDAPRDKGGRPRKEAA